MNKSPWKTVRLETVAEIQTGISKSASRKLIDPIEVPYLRVANVQDGHLDLSVIKHISIERKNLERYTLKTGDVLLTEGGDFDKLGRGTVWNNEIESCVHQNHVFSVRTDASVLQPEFLSILTASSYGKRYFISCSKQSTNLASINSTQLKQFPVLLPSLDVQKSIVSASKLWDNAIEKTEALIAAKEKQFEWLCTNLLSGRKESFGFTGKSIPTAFGSIFSLFKKVNTSCADYEVLSVTKDGIVSQSEYFNKEVASKDKSKYLIVDKDTLVMSGLNFWMGAIDFQTIRDTGIVSPAYKTFKVNEGPYNRDYLRFFIRSHYMTKILLDSSIQGASIVRRNLDMEWLSNSLIDLPNLEEQIDIANILSLAEKEIDGLKLLAEKYRSQKRGLMQKLLTGEWQVGSSQHLSEETYPEASA